MIPFLGGLILLYVLSNCVGLEDLICTWMDLQINLKRYVIMKFKFYRREL